MSETEIIKIEYEAIKRFCQGDKKLALKITSELGRQMRNHIQYRNPQKVTVEELCTLIEATLNWTN